MENGRNGRNGAKSFMHKPAVRIGFVVLVVHAICWIGWDAINPAANSMNAAAVKANANHERIRAAIETKN